MAREFLSKLIASCFPLSSTLSELASSQENQRLGVGPHAPSVYYLEVKHGKGVPL